MNHLESDARGVIVPCPACQRANRIAFERLHQSGRCAACGAPLPAPGAPVDIDDEAAFVAATTRSTVPVLVDFWAPWCGPCKMMGPELDAAARAAAGKWLAVKLNTEELPGPAQRAGVTSIPLLVLFNGGREIARSAGARPAAAITDFVAQHL